MAYNAMPFGAPQPMGGYMPQAYPAFPQQPVPSFPQQPFPAFPQQSFPGFPQQPFPSFPQSPPPTFPQQTPFPQQPFPMAQPVPQQPFPQQPFPQQPFPQQQLPQRGFLQTSPPKQPPPQPVPQPQAPIAVPPPMPQGHAPAAPVATNASANGMIQLCSDEEMEQAFATTLNLLKRDIVPNLRPGADGHVQITVPFCGSFPEARALHEFLKEVVPTLPVEAVNVHVFDAVLNVNQSLEALDEHPKIVYMTSQTDLNVNPMPPSTVTFALHPKATQPGWDKIIQNVISNSTVTIFFLFAEAEKDKLQEICKAVGFSCVAKQNPFAKLQFTQAGAPINDSLKKYNFLALVRRAQGQGHR